MCRTSIIIFLLIKIVSCDKITNLNNKKYVLTETDLAFLFENSEYLYHVTNLTTILTPYEKIKRNMYNINESQEEMLLINRIETLKSQLIPHSNRVKRSLNFLGSILKFITGTPDHDDLIEIKSGLNQLIKNNNQQRKINSQFEKILKTLDPKSINENIILNVVYQELVTITNTINFAKHGNFYSGTLNLNDVKEIIINEEIDIPIINILEYADIHICMYQNSIITIYKYPLITKKCKLYNITPLMYKHGKIVIDKNIAECKHKYTRVNNCRNYVGINICTQLPEDNCTIPLLEDKKAKCNIIQENNKPLLILDYGQIITDGEHVWNEYPIKGPNLIQFNISTKIDNKTYFNHEQEIKNVIHAHTYEQLEILRILTSDSDYKFTNIQKMYKFLIPIEQHPLEFALYSIFVIITLTLIIYSCTKLYLYQQQRANIKRRKNYEEAYNIELRQLTQAS